MTKEKKIVIPLNFKSNVSAKGQFSLKPVTNISAKTRKTYLTSNSAMFLMSLKQLFLKIMVF